MTGLETPRLRLRQWRDSDRAPFAALNADPAVMEFFPALLAREASDASVEAFGAAIDERGWGNWAVEVRETGEFAGFVGISIPKRVLPFSPCVEIGWRLARAHWGRGYATEGAREALRFGFEELGLDEIVSFTTLGNVRSRAVMERIGMRNASENFEHPGVPEGNSQRPHCLYRIRRRDWSRCAIDHIVIAAPTLEAGAAFVRETLGVSPQGGGKHALMGTHNQLLRLGERVYLEAIAIDPSAPAPGRPRWFGLDTRAAGAPPALQTWVARTPGVRSAGSTSSEPLGAAEPMSRGALNWLITVPDDGAIPLDGVGPALIEWPTGVHPAASLQDHGLSLAALELAHPDAARVSRMLESLGLAGSVSVVRGSAPRLVARIDTPRGPASIGSNAE